MTIKQQLDAAAENELACWKRFLHLFSRDCESGSNFKDFILKNIQQRLSSLTSERVEQTQHYSVPSGLVPDTVPVVHRTGYVDRG
jgi:hypothetical protein